MKMCFCLLLSLITSAPLMADWNSNQSAEFFRMPSRAGLVNSTDAVVANPAGLVKLEDGMYINVGNAMALNSKYTQISPDGNTYASSTFIPFIPNLFAVYKTGDWVGFIGLNVPGGGGSLNFKDGIASLLLAMPNLALLEPNVKMSSMYLSMDFGGSYAINKFVSISAAAVVIYGNNSVQLSTAIANPLLGEAMSGKMSVSATGFTGRFGINITPMDEMNIGLKYQPVAKLNFGTTITGDAITTQIINGLGYTDGAKFREDLPGLFTAGLSYTFFEKDLLTNLSFNHYGIKSAKGTAEYANNYYSIGIGAAYKIMPKLELSTGFEFFETGLTADYVSDTKMDLDSYSFGLGGAYSFTDQLKAGLGFLFAAYGNMTNTLTTIEYDKRIVCMAFNVEYKF